MGKAKQEIKINVPAAVQGGVYANNVVIGHTREEFVLDCLMITPFGAGAVTARIIMSPGHTKRLMQALQVNMKKYEQKFGKIEPAKPPEGKMGFQPPSTS